MKKWLKSVGITFVLMAIICMVFWKIEWISSWKEVVTLYGIVVVVIAISTLITNACVSSRVFVMIFPITLL